MKINTDEITSVIKQEIQRYSAELDVSNVGQVKKGRDKKDA